MTPPPGSGAGCLRAKHLLNHVAAFVIPFNFDMQHDHDLKKLNFNLLSFDSQGRCRGLGVCGQNICYHVAAFVFNLICNMTMF